MIQETLDLLCYCRKVKTKQPASYKQICMLIKQICKDVYTKNIQNGGTINVEKL